MELQANTNAKQRVSTRAVAVVGLMSAIAFVLQLLGMFLPRVGGFLDIEFSDLPALLASLAIGPAAGVVVELVKNVLHCTVTTTGFVGEFANFVINGIFVFLAGMIYKRNKTRKNAVAGLCVGVVVMVAAGVLANLFIMLPLYMPGAPFANKMQIILTFIVPFNFVRGTVLSVLILLLYKRVSKWIKA